MNSDTMCIKQIPMKRESSSSWELIFVLPANHGTLFFLSNQILESMNIFYFF